MLILIVIPENLLLLRVSEYLLMIVYYIRCLLVGNAAFHSRELYPTLHHCIEPLTNILLDTDEKARANAAGALGNLLRNSGELCEAIVSYTTIPLLMTMIISDRILRFSYLRKS